MNSSTKNKNPSQTGFARGKEQNQTKEVKKKTCIIKLEVNKLFARSNFHRSTKSQQFESHQVFQTAVEHQKSLEKQNGTKNQKKVIKSFEQLYFEKIKQRKLQSSHQQKFHSFEEQKVLAQKNKPSSCKNIVTLKTKNNPFFPSPQSTKNLSSLENKENILGNKQEKQRDFLAQNKFFKKKDSKTSENFLELGRNLQKSIQKIETVKQMPLKNIDSEPKTKKILKIKRSSKPQTKETAIQQIEQNQFKQLLEVQENSIHLPINFVSNPSAELKTIKLSTPSSSAEKFHPLPSTESHFDKICLQKIDHSTHEHIWDRTQCFFCFQEFQLILQELGFKDTFHTKEIGFYFQKLWENLGGDLYGGVVRKNLRSFINLILSDDEDLNSEIAEALTSKSEMSLEENFIDKGSLKLKTLNLETKDRIRKFYFPFRITKIASQIHHLHSKENSEQKLPNSINSDKSLSNKSKSELSDEKKKSNRSNISEPKDKILQNGAYLDTISVKNRNQDLSPYMVPRIYDSSNEMSLVTDFSPKMAAQKYEQFKSTILNKQDMIEKLETEQEEEFQGIKSQQTKPLLSVDVNLGEGVLEKLLVYEGQNPYEISVRLKQRYNIDEELREKFEKMLRNHLNTLLFKIEEVSEEMLEDSVELLKEDSDTIKDFVLIPKE